MSIRTQKNTVCAVRNVRCLFHLLQLIFFLVISAGTVDVL